MPLTDEERDAARDNGIVVFDDRVILEAQPPIDDATLAEVAERCAGPLPGALVELWRTTFGGSLDYDLTQDDMPLSMTELFYPGSDNYNDLWGWIDHERELAGADRLAYLPIGGFEYLDRVYVCTTPGADHGVVVSWQQGLPPGWELKSGDRTGRLAADLHGLFEQLVLERDPWGDEGEDVDAGSEVRDAIDELAEGGATERSAAGKLRALVTATVLDWRAALEPGASPRLRRLAMDRVAAGDDVELLRRLTLAGCDPTHSVRGGLAPIDIALMHRSGEVTRWLLDRGVPVRNTLRAAAQSIDLDLARDLLARGAAVDAHTISSAVNNPDVDVVQLLASSLPDHDGLDVLAPRLRMLAAQAGIAADRAADPADRDRHRRRATILRELAGPQ
ncbi:hypothetical protein ACQPZX_11600 [Actinoplanes sp. CA-142083]|uniref:hypothetical protein n=1 Tax=Actinoplanes sp. CA-142083 TaxID=3239903 RepID=UPI003D8DF05F